MPLREYRPLTRASDEVKEYKVIYYILCEGENTEWIYFTGLSDYQKEIGIQNHVQLIPLEKLGNQRGWSQPEKLFELAEQKRNELKSDGSYEPDDRFVLVFDLDIYRKNPTKYRDLLAQMKVDEMVVVTNPCYELWMLLHLPSSYNGHIKNDTANILLNKKTNRNHTYVSSLAKRLLGFNTKGKYDFSILLNKVENAINEEKFMCEDPTNMLGTVGCNMGLFITKLKEKHFE